MSAVPSVERGTFIRRLPGVVADLNVYAGAPGWLIFVVLAPDGSETETVIPIRPENLPSTLWAALLEIKA